MSGVDRHLATVQGLEMVIGEPDPDSFEVDVRSSGQVGSQEYREAVTVSDGGSRTLSQLKL